MKKGISRLAAIGLFLAVPALASAPATQYQAFDESSAAITDRQTGLVWQRVAVPSRSYADATGYCAAHAITSLDPNNNPITTPARLPTIKELLSLVDEQPHKEYVGVGEVTMYIDGNAFGGEDSIGERNTPVDHPYLSQTSTVTGTHFAIDFSTGLFAPVADVDTGSASAYIRCVAP